MKASGTVRVRLAHRLGERHGRLAVRARQLRPHQVHAGVGVRAAAADGLLQAAAHRAEGVGAGDDDEVRIHPVAGVHGRAVFPDRLILADDHLARDVTAALGEDLVLDVNPGHAAAHVLLHRPDGRQRVAVAVVGVGDDRDLDGAGHHGADAGHLGLGEEAHVGPAVGQGHRVAAEVDGLHAHPLGDLGVERGVDAAGEQIGLGAEQVAKHASGIVHELGLQSVQVERANGSHVGRLEQRAGAGWAVGRRFQRDRAGGTEGRSAIQASEAVKRACQFTLAAALTHHGHLLAGLESFVLCRALTVPPRWGRGQPHCSYRADRIS